MAESKGRYEDIINLPHPTSKKHPRMTLYNRAAQFSPFAALTGHDAAIRETARLTDRKIELDETMKAELDEKLRIILENLDREVEASISYFVPDEKKSGGRYAACTGRVKRIDSYRRAVVMEDASVIPIEQIYEIDSALFSEYGLQD